MKLETKTKPTENMPGSFPTQAFVQALPLTWKALPSLPKSYPSLQMLPSYNTHTHACACVHAHACIHTCTYIHMHACRCTHAQTHFSIVHWSQVFRGASTTSSTHLSSYGCRAQVLGLQRPELNPWLLRRPLPPRLQDYRPHRRVSASGWGGSRRAGGTL